MNLPFKDEPMNYPFKDSDDEDEGDKVDMRETGLNKKKNIQFKEQEQKQKYLKNQPTGNNLFKSMGGDFYGQKKTTNQFTASIRPKVKNLNSLAIGEYYDFNRKEGGSDKKREAHRIFDDMDLK